MGGPRDEGDWSVKFLAYYVARPQGGSRLLMTRVHSLSFSSPPSPPPQRRHRTATRGAERNGGAAEESAYKSHGLLKDVRK